MIKQILTVVALVGLMSTTAMAQSSGSGSGSGGASGSQNPSAGPSTSGGIGNSNTTVGGSDSDSSTGMYRDSQGRPCNAGSAGCSREDTRNMKKQ